MVGDGVVKFFGLKIGDWIILVMIFLVGVVNMLDFEFIGIF